MQRREGGIIWHTQGSGKSLIMVWLAKWIRENVTDPRVLIITDRTELDEQIEKVFQGRQRRHLPHQERRGPDRHAQRDQAVADLLADPQVRRQGRRATRTATSPSYIEEMKKALPPDFKAKGNLFVFVDECHRTQSGELHEAMKAILPGAVFIGFTGTPLLKADKQKSIEVFGRYIHTYKFDEAVKDGVVLDLRYEARDIDQNITSQAKIDQWFEAKTKGLTDLAKAQLKQRWGTMQKVLSSQVAAGKDRRRHPDGHGDARPAEERTRQRHARLRQHLRGVQVLRAVRQDRPGGQVRHRHLLQAVAADIKGEESGEGDDREAASNTTSTRRCWPTGSTSRRKRRSTRSRNSRRR